MQSAEYLGADTVVTCSTSAGGTLADTLAARLPGRFDARRGHARAPRLGRRGRHYFDAATGLRRDDVVPRSRLTDRSKETRMKKSPDPIALAAAALAPPCPPRRRR